MRKTGKTHHDDWLRFEAACRTCLLPIVQPTCQPDDQSIHCSSRTCQVTGSHPVTPSCPFTLHSGLVTMGNRGVTTNRTLHGGCTFERPCPGATLPVKTNGTKEEPMHSTGGEERGRKKKKGGKGKKRNATRPPSNGEVCHVGKEPVTALSHDCDEHYSIKSAGSAQISIHPRR